MLIANWTWYPSGGDWTAIENLMKLYGRHGHTIIPFAMKDERNFPTPYERYFVEHIDYKEMNREKSLRNGITVLKRAIYSKEARTNLGKLLGENKVDVANVHNLGPQITWSILPLLKERRIPILYTVHDYGMLCPNVTFLSNGKICEKCKGGNFYQCTWNRCKKNSYAASAVATLKAYIDHWLGVREYIDVFICPSRRQMEKFIEFGYDRDRLVHLYNPYDTGELQAGGGDAGVPYSNYILFVGRLERIKGIQTLLHAMRDIRKVDLVVIGSGGEEAACRDFVRDNGLSHVHLLGQMRKADIVPYLRNCMFAVCPSECFENLPYSVIEAMALGKPVIGSDIGGIPELVIDGHTGLTFRPGDGNDLGEKIGILAADQAAIREYGENARRHVARITSYDAYYESIEGILGKLGVH